MWEMSNLQPMHSMSRQNKLHIFKINNYFYRSNLLCSQPDITKMPAYVSYWPVPLHDTVKNNI